MKFTGTVIGKALRIAPSLNGRQAANSWKFWASGNEAYATCRIMGATAKYSFHASGFSQQHLGAARRQQLYPPTLVGEGNNWLHALEIRFVRYPSSGFPKPEKAKKPNEGVYLLPMAETSVLTLNLLVGAAGTSGQPPPPREFTPAPLILWRSSFVDKRPAILIARCLIPDPQTIEWMETIEAKRPRVGLHEKPNGNEYLEVSHTHWSVGGNVVFVASMGRECHLHEPLPSADPITDDIDIRKLSISTIDCSIPLLAPDGAVIANLAFRGIRQELSLAANRSIHFPFGSVTVQLNSKNLIPGSKFRVRPFELPIHVSIGTTTNQISWSAIGEYSFDGKTLEMEFSSRSGVVGDSNSGPHWGSGTDEELVLVAPNDQVHVTVDSTQSATEIEIEARMRLRVRT